MTCHSRKRQAEFTSQGMNHSEGGWPKDINAAEADMTMRYRKKIEKDDAYMRATHSLALLMEDCVKVMRMIIMTTGIMILPAPGPGVENNSLWENLLFHETLSNQFLGWVENHSALTGAGLNKTKKNKKKNYNDNYI